MLTNQLSSCNCWKLITIHNAVNSPNLRSSHNFQSQSPIQYKETNGLHTFLQAQKGCPTRAADVHWKHAKVQAFETSSHKKAGVCLGKREGKVRQLSPAPIANKRTALPLLLLYYVETWYALSTTTQRISAEGKVDTHTFSGKVKCN